MIRRIATLDPDTYAAFCRWLREDQGTTIGELLGCSVSELLEGRKE